MTPCSLKLVAMHLLDRCSVVILKCLSQFTAVMADRPFTAEDWRADGP